MRQPENIKTTLGDLIAAVTSEVSAWINDSPGMYIVASYIVSDLLSKRKKRNAPCEIIFDSSIFGRQFGRRKAVGFLPTWIATRSLRDAGQNRFDVSENDRWAEPLEENFTRVLSRNLGMLLGGAWVIRYPWHTSQRLTYQIRMEVLRFESNTQEVELVAGWALIDLSNKTSLVSKESRIARQTGTKSIEASVAALSETLGDLSREIADTILARFRPDDR